MAVVVQYYRISIVFVIWYVFVFTPLAEWLESDIRRHMLIQIPVLCVLGFVSGVEFNIKTDFLNKFDSQGWASVLLASLTIIYWMIPRHLDAAILFDEVSLVKYISLPLLVGIPFAHGWSRISGIFKGMIIIEFIAMLFRLGWLYFESPIRICSSYALAEQNLLGRDFMLIAVVLILYWSAKCLLPSEHTMQTFKRQ